MKLVKLTDSNGNAVYIDPDRVLSITPSSDSPGHSVVAYEDKRYFFIQGDATDVYEALAANKEAS